MPDLLEGTLPPITTEQMVNELNREIGMRRSVYPRLIEKGKMSTGEASERIRILEAIRERVAR